MDFKKTKEELLQLLRIKVPLVDYQHECMLVFFEKILKDDVEQDDFYKVLLEICNFLHTHFKTEEKLMKLCNYPYLLEHQKEHSKMLRSFKKILKAGVVNADFVTLSGEIKKLILDWNNSHYNFNTDEIAGDVKFIEYFRLFVTKNQ